MSYQIDQSGKIEQTGIKTVIALSNSTHFTIILRAKDKRELQNIFREAGKPRVFSVQVFSAMTYLLLEKSKVEEGIVWIDKEYPGHEDVIKSYITQLIHERKKVRLNPENIRFTLVGKSSNAHLLGYKAFKSGRVNFKAKKEEILALILTYDK